MLDDQLRLNAAARKLVPLNRVEESLKAGWRVVIGSHRQIDGRMHLLMAEPATGGGDDFIVVGSVVDVGE